VTRQSVLNPSDTCGSEPSSRLAASLVAMRASLPRGLIKNDIGMLFLAESLLAYITVDQVIRKTMPFTPFHMGPGAAIKAVTGKYFSLMVFGFAQVAMDVEPLVRILRGDGVLHGFSHTYVGALLIGIISLLIGKAVSERLLRAWNVMVRFRHSRWLVVSPGITWPAAASGAFIGTFSHVFLDSIMHSDMQPFSPFSASNGLLHIMPVGWLYLLCVFLGVSGLMIMLAFDMWKK
jgi:hypothetical protein